MDRTITFRLPLPGAPRAVVVTDYGLRFGRLTMQGETIVEASSPAALAGGVTARLPGTERRLTLRASPDGELQVLVDDVEALPEEGLRARPVRSSWVHAWVALSGSLFGFAAGALYVLRAEVTGDAWAMKMALHMAAWHLLLVLTLFPTSVWGGRPGIRAVQGVGAVFFLIHLGIALANTGSSPERYGDAIALLNALSGLGFLATVLYGQRAHRDRDPIAQLQARSPHSP